MFQLIVIVGLFDLIHALELEGINAFNYYKTAYTYLNDNNKMPIIGYGTWLGSYRTAESYKKVKRLGPEVEVGVELAIDLGFKLIETAPVYNSEEIIGRVMTKKINEGQIKREDLFLVTKSPATLKEVVQTIKLNNFPYGNNIDIAKKLPFNLLDRYHCSKYNVTKALRDSLKKLNTKYIDLYIIQFPIGFDEQDNYIEYDRLQVWKMLVEAKFRRQVRSVGVSNFDRSMISELYTSGLMPAVLEVEANVGMQQNDLQEFCRDNNITLMSYAPLGHIHNRIPGEMNIWHYRDLKNIADDLFRTEAQISLRFLYELDIVPIVRTVLKTEMEEYSHIFDFELSDKEMEDLRRMDRNENTFKFTFIDPKHGQYYANQKVVL